VGQRKRVVLDTNTLISALGWEGKPHQVLGMCMRKQVELILSSPIIEELEVVMNYPKFGFSEEMKREFLAELIECARIVSPAQKVQVIANDPEDNKFVECAIAGEANYIVSGDGHLLSLREYRGIRIINASDFLKALQV